MATQFDVSRRSRRLAPCRAAWVEERGKITGANRLAPFIFPIGGARDELGFRRRKFPVEFRPVAPLGSATVARDAGDRAPFSLGYLGFEDATVDDGGFLAMGFRHRPLPPVGTAATGVAQGATARGPRSHHP